jgi:hypothetical protein
MSVRVNDQATFDQVEGLSAIKPGYKRHMGARKTRTAKHSKKSKDGGMFGGYIVRGPQGEFYGRYNQMPAASQMPPYSIVETEKPGFKVGFGEDEEAQGMF